MKLTRRQVVVGLISLGGAGALAGRFGLRVKASVTPAPEPLFAAGPQRALEAALDRVLPGCVAAGVMDHLGYWVRHDKVFEMVRKEFDAGASWLDKVATHDHQKSFADATDAQRDAVLRKFQQNQIRPKGFDGRAFFEHLVAMALEGFLGDPKYGGNKGLVGWNLIGKSHCWWAPRQAQRVLSSPESWAY